MNTDQQQKTADKRRSDAVRILARLRQGPATMLELAALVHSYRQRISDCRASGWLINCKRTPSGSVFSLVGHKDAGQLAMAI